MSFRTHWLLARGIFLKRHAAMFALASVCLCAGHADAKAYKGAEIATQMAYKYGRMEVRMRMARGSGILSTFFTYKPGSEGAGALWEEIDVEVFGKSNATSWQSNLLTGNPRMGSEQVHQTGFSLADDYHTFTIEWTPTAVVWLLDGVEARRTTGGQASQLTSSHAFHFNLWASDVASWAGDFESSALPATQYVNWMKYYRYENNAFVLDWTDDFNTFDAARWSKANWTFDGNLVDFDPNNAVVKDGTLVLCMTPQGQTGCAGAVPVDSAGNAGGTGGGGAGGVGGGGASGAGGAGGTGGAGGMSGAAGTGGALAGGGTAPTAGSGAGGVATSGGQAGIGGMAATAAGAAGAQAVAGGSAIGGTSTASAGTAPGDNSAVPASPAADANGCTCAVPAQNSGGQGALLLVGALLLRARGRRKQR